MYKIPVLFILLVLPFILSATEIKGIIKDASTNEPLIGAVVQVLETNLSTVTGMDGSYLIRNVSPGEYEFAVSYLGYSTLNKTVSVDGSSKSMVMNFDLSSADQMLGVVEVSARAVSNTEFNARLTEKLASNIVNVVSSQSIELSPDITVANVMQRVSGIALERNHTGDGQHAIIRGMDKRYNYSLVNGVKIPSPDNDNRFVPLDIFPADLMDRIELTKALTPDMEGDAIGGVINMIMKDAPEGMSLSVNMGTGFNSIFINDLDYATFNTSVINKESPVRRNGPGYLANMDDFALENANIEKKNFQPLNQIYGLSIGNRFGPQNQLGVLVAGSYQNTSRGSNSIFFGTSTDRETNIPSLNSVTLSERSSRQTRSGIHAKLDYVVNPNHRFDFYTSVINLQEVETRNMIDTNLVISRNGPGTGRIEQWVRTRQRISTIFTNNLSGKHQIHRNVTFDWSGIYSRATYLDPDMSEFMVISGRTSNNDGGFDQSPWLYDNTNYRGFWRRWRGNSDTDYAGYSNLSYTPQLFGADALIKAGGMFRMKQRENYFDRYRLNPEPARQEWEGNVLDNTFRVGTPGGTTQNALNYLLDETIYAYYLMGRIEPFKDFQIAGGIRVEHTDLSWDSNAPTNIEGRIGNINYVDYLPSIHFRYNLNGSQNFRLSYFESISRQGYFEIIPYQFYEDDQFRQAGNPNLDRAYAKNLDFRYEMYPAPLDKLMVGVFYKNIENPIEYTVVRRPDLGNNVFLSPGNFGTAINYGFELDFTKYFNSIGFRGNYTYTESQITTDKFFYFRNEEGMLTNRIEQQTRPLQGQSKHLANFSVLYNNANTGTNAQLSAVYTGDRIAFVSSTVDNDQWQRAMTQLDFSFEQKFMQRFTGYIKVNNLLNTPYELEIRKPNSKVADESDLQIDPNRILTRLDYFQRTFLVGVKFKL